MSMLTTISSTLVMNVLRPLIETAINEDLKESTTWFKENSLKANPDKFQGFGLALGRSSIDLRFKVDGLELQQENY